MNFIPCVMTTCISLLRGINVGGHRKITMPDLRELYVSVGFTAVQTYIQSGNAIFRYMETEAGNLSGIISNAIHQAFNLDVAVVVRSAAEWKLVIERMPYPHLSAETIHVIFLSTKPSGIVPVCTPEDEKRSAGKWYALSKEIYLHCPQGFSKFKFPSAFTEKNLGVYTTTRNWETVLKLYEIAGKSE